jgi:hypothetical protein
MQSPFYEDISTDFNRTVWFRVHCSLIDVLIVLGSIAPVSGGDIDGCSLNIPDKIQVD